MLKKNSLKKILMVVACMCSLLFAFTSNVQAAAQIDSNTKVKVWVEPICENSEVYLYDITVGDFEKLICMELPKKLPDTNNFLIVFENAEHFNEFRKITDKLNSETPDMPEFPLQYVGNIDKNHLEAIKEFGFTEIATVAYLAINTADAESQQ